MASLGGTQLQANNAAPTFQANNAAPTMQATNSPGQMGGGLTPTTGGVNNVMPQPSNPQPMNGSSGGWSAAPSAVGGFNTPGLQYGTPGTTAQQQNTIGNPSVDQSRINAGNMPVSSVGVQPNYMQNMQDAYYDQATSRLNPQFEQRQQGLESQLANMGLTRGSAAWNREMSNFNRDRNDAYNTAQNTAILNSGAEAQRAQGMDIAGGNFANQAHQMNYNNQRTSQQDYNAAAGQQFGQNLQAGTFANQAQQQEFQQGIDRANLNNSAIHGRDSINAQNRSTDVNAQIANARIGADRDMFNRSTDLAQQRQDYDITRSMSFDPITMQNMMMQGMSPGSMPGMPNYPTAPQLPGGNHYNSALGSNAQQQNNSNLWGSALGALGGWFFGG